MTDVIELANSPLDVPALIRAAQSPASGAVVVFLGDVRDHHEGRRVLALEYEAYPEMALERMRAIAVETRERWPLHGLAVAHRIGRLEIGETSVVIAVSCAHRGAAFSACRHVIDRIKEDVPIWKKEYYEGGECWVGAPS